MLPQEREPLPRRAEERILARFGYDRFFDVPLTDIHGLPIIGEDGCVVTGGRFLDTYSDLERRQHTHDMLEGFLGLDPTDPDYAAAQSHIGSYLRVYFGDPNPGAG